LCLFISNCARKAIRLLVDNYNRLRRLGLIGVLSANQQADILDVYYYHCDVRTVFAIRIEKNSSSSGIPNHQRQRVNSPKWHNFIPDKSTETNKETSLYVDTSRSGKVNINTITNFH